MREFPGLRPIDFETMTRSEAAGLVQSLAAQLDPAEISEASAKAARAALAGRLRATVRYLVGS